MSASRIGINFKGRVWSLMCLSLLAFGITVGSLPLNAEDESENPANQVDSTKAKERDAALERTRREVRMLDDIYKTGVVLVTQNFVDGDSFVPAGTVFKQLFAAAKEKGWHEIRLLDATGEAIDDENLPNDEFEKRAIKQLLAGKKYVEQVIEIDGQRHLRAATPIPVVLEKCVECHDNYANVPAGQPIGALAYTLKIIE